MKNRYCCKGTENFLLKTLLKDYSSEVQALSLQVILDLKTG